MAKKHIIIYAFLISGWLLFIFTLLFHHQIVGLFDNNSFESQEKKYPLLSKRILNEFPNDILISFLDLRTELAKQTEPYGQDFGFYFEYLPTGTSIGINSTNEFYAASLFKVPVIIAYYKSLERTNSMNDFSKEVTVEKDDIDSQFGDLWELGPGTKIKMSEAVRLALEKSDNTAAKVIAKRVLEEDFDSVYEGIDIDLNTASGGAILTTRNYSSILKALYFSSVLSKESSNEILDYLSQSNFNDQLKSGLPEDIKVAHKIGEYRAADGATAFMDCGIVYLPRRPYLLCMLSVGDKKTAHDRMSKLSKTIYEYVSAK